MGQEKKKRRGLTALRTAVAGLVTPLRRRRDLGKHSQKRIAPSDVRS